MRCKRCKRKLTNVKSQVRGYGSTCYKRTFGSYSLIKDFFPNTTRDDVRKLSEFWDECQKIKKNINKKVIKNER